MIGSSAMNRECGPNRDVAHLRHLTYDAPRTSSYKPNTKDQTKAPLKQKQPTRNTIPIIEATSYVQLTTPFFSGFFSASVRFLSFLLFDFFFIQRGPRVAGVLVP